MTTQSNIIYASEPELDVAEFRRVLVESTLGETRPVDDDARLQAMLSGANLVLTARLDVEGTPLIGVIRASPIFPGCATFQSSPYPNLRKASASAKA
ncbi:hypothetical protein [Mesorhizobium sp. L2C066B000]|uniref:hypothetical protein n=1 Tax=Mesorhizobium sp. L2C066B000 TaxID=1287105 RepID=UPI000ADC69A3